MNIWPFKTDTTVELRFRALTIYLLRLLVVSLVRIWPWPCEVKAIFTRSVQGSSVLKRYFFRACLAPRAANLYYYIYIFGKFFSLQITSNRLIGQILSDQVFCPFKKKTKPCRVYLLDGIYICNMLGCSSGILIIIFLTA